MSWEPTEDPDAWKTQDQIGFLPCTPADFQDTLGFAIAHGKTDILLEVDERDILMAPEFPLMVLHCSRDAGFMGYDSVMFIDPGSPIRKFIFKLMGEPCQGIGQDLLAYLKGKHLEPKLDEPGHAVY